jgi:hypothetical protein
MSEGFKPLQNEPKQPKCRLTRKLGMVLMGLASLVVGFSSNNAEGKDSKVPAV